MANRLVEIPGFSSCSGFSVDNLSDVIYNYSTPTFTQGQDVRSAPSGDYIINLDTLKIKYENGMFALYGVNGALIASCFPNLSNWNYFGFAFAVDDTNQNGSVVCCYSSSGGYWANFTMFGNYEVNSVYQAIIGAEVQAIVANGGGATHIAKVTGQLSSLSNNLSDILMVSGGGGGGLLMGEDAYNGKDAGGISGMGNNSGNQTTGSGFGQGESGSGVPGGGSGLYGGYRGGS